MPLEIDVEYDKFINKLAETSDTRTITNGSSSHALSILRSVFKHSKNYVKIFTGRLCETVYNDDTLLIEAANFISKGGKLEILIQEGGIAAIAGHKFLESIKKNCNDTKDINSRLIIKGLDDSHVLSKADVHFLVADDKIYRVEDDITNKTAVGCFNDPERSMKLNAIFESAFSINTLAI
ncbi:MAG: hypothetical protein WAV95_17835 [Azonexus sp.]